MHLFLSAAVFIHSLHFTIHLFFSIIASFSTCPLVQFIQIRLFFLYSFCCYSDDSTLIAISLLYLLSFYIIQRCFLSCSFSFYGTIIINLCNWSTNYLKPLVNNILCKVALTILKAHRCSPNNPLLYFSAKDNFIAAYLYPS